MLMVGNDGKVLVIAKKGENNIADFVHDCAESNHFNFRVAFVQVVVPENRIVGDAFSGNTDADNSNSKNGASCDGRPPF